MNMKKGKTIRIPLLGDMVVSLYRTLIGIALGLVASGILIAISGVNPFTAYGALIKGAFGSKYAISNVLVRSSPLLLGGIGRLQKSDPERVDAKKLRIRACGGLVAGALYLACRYLQL